MIFARRESSSCISALSRRHRGHRILQILRVARHRPGRHRLRVWIYEIRQDGSSILLSGDQVRARYRENARAAKLITTRAPLRYDFDNFTFISQLVKKEAAYACSGPINSIYRRRTTTRAVGSRRGDEGCAAGHRHAVSRPLTPQHIVGADGAAGGAVERRFNTE